MVWLVVYTCEFPRKRGRLGSGSGVENLYPFLQGGCYCGPGCACARFYPECRALPVATGTSEALVEDGSITVAAKRAHKKGVLEEFYLEVLGAPVITGMSGLAGVGVAAATARGDS